MSERIGKYLSVRDEPVAPGRKTRVWSVLTNHGDVLGFVRWFGRWRQYTFDPSTGTGFNRDCLLDIAGGCESPHHGGATRSWADEVES